MAETNLRSKTHSITSALEELRQLEEDLDAEDDVHGETSHYIDAKIREILQYIERIDDYRIVGAESVLKHLSDSVLRESMPEEEVEYVQEECLEARLLIEGVMLEWENELSEQS